MHGCCLSTARLVRRLPSADVASRRLCNAAERATESGAPRRRDIVRVGRGSGSNDVLAQATVAPVSRGAELRRRADSGAQGCYSAPVTRLAQRGLRRRVECARVEAKLALKSAGSHPFLLRPRAVLASRTEVPRPRRTRGRHVACFLVCLQDASSILLRAFAGFLGLFCASQTLTDICALVPRRLADHVSSVRIAVPHTAV